METIRPNSNVWVRLNFSDDQLRHDFPCWDQFTSPIRTRRLEHERDEKEICRIVYTQIYKTVRTFREVDYVPSTNQERMWSVLLAWGYKRESILG